MKMAVGSKSETLVFTDLGATIFWKISFTKSTANSSNLASYFVPNLASSNYRKKRKNASQNSRYTTEAVTPKFSNMKRKC